MTNGELVQPVSPTYHRTWLERYESLDPADRAIVDAEMTAFRRLTATVCAAPAQRGLRHLDLGTCTGRYLRWSAEQGFRTICGVDSSPAAIAYCAGLSQPGRVHLYHSDFALDSVLAGIGRADGPFHLVTVMLGTIDHLGRDEQAALLTAVAQVLDPAGALVVSTWRPGRCRLSLYTEPERAYLESSGFGDLLAGVAPVPPGLRLASTVTTGWHTLALFTPVGGGAVSVLVLNRQPLADLDYAGLLGGGSDVVVLTGSGSLDPDADPGRYAEIVVVPDLTDSAAVEHRALESHQRHRFTRVVALSERDVLRAARLRERLDLPGQRPDSALAYRDKVVMKRLLAAAGLPLARFAPVDTAADLAGFAAGNGFPVVVKPRAEAGSVGVRVLRSAAELADYTDTEPALHTGRAARLLVEEYVPHELQLVDGVAADGKLLWCWPSWMSSMLGHLTGEPLFCRTLQPADPLVPALRDLAERAVAALPPADLTTIHAEVFRTPDGRLVFNEIASRVGGAKINQMLACAFGAGPTEIYLRAVRDPAGLRLPPPEPPRAAGFAMIRQRPGRVVALPEECPLPAVVEYRRLVRPGTVLAAPKSGVAFVAGLVVAGADDAAVRRDLAAALDWFADESLIELTEPRSGELVDADRPER